MAEGRSPLPIACDLAGGDLAARRGEVSALLGESRRAERLPDGYAFEFDGAPETARRLVEFVNAERSCCRFLRFEMVFEPDGGPTWLRVRGPEGTADFVRDAMFAEGG